MTQAEPSLTSVPSGAREIRLVSGPPILVSLVSSNLSGGGVLFCRSVFRRPRRRLLRLFREVEFGGR